MPSDPLLSVSPSATEPVASAVRFSQLAYVLCGAVDVCGAVEKTRLYRANPCDRTKKRCVMLHPGGEFMRGQMAAKETLNRASGLAAIDIDHRADGVAIDPASIPQLRTRMANDPHVLVLAPSMSGLLWGLIYRPRDWQTARSYFELAYGLDVGAQGDVRRGRFLAADCSIDDVITNQSAQAFAESGDASVIPPPEGAEDWTRSTVIDLSRDELFLMLGFIDPFCDMVEWVRRLGCIKAQLGEGGKALAEKWSRGELLKPGIQKGKSYFDATRFESAWSSLARAGATAKTLVMLAHQAGYSKHPQIDPKTFVWTERTARTLGWDRDFVMRDNGKVGFVHVPTRHDYTSEGLDLRYGRYLLTADQRKKGKVKPAIAPSDVIANVLQVPCIGDDIFRPGEPAIVESHGRAFLNLWQEDGPAPVLEAAWSADQRADVGRVREHLTWMLGASHAAILVAFLALVIQREGRVHWCPLLVGPDGCGKTIVAKMMKGILGRNATHIDAPSVMTSQFNDFAAGHEFAALEEVKSSDRANDNGAEVLDKMKPLITNEHVTWHRKGKAAFLIENMQTYFASTNHVAALKLTSDDRRWCPLRARFGSKVEYEADLESRGGASDYFTALHRAVERSPEALRGWLLASPPMRSPGIPPL